MKKVVRKFTSHAEADAADRAYYHSLTPEQRIEILLQLIASQRPANEAPPRLAQVVESLNFAGAKYVIVGGYAVAFHGHPRFTGDIDFFVEASPENAAKITEAIDHFGFSSLGLKPEDFTTPDAIVQLGFPPNRIDIINSIQAVTFDEAWGSRLLTHLDGLPVAFISKELLIRNKTAAKRPKDLGDIDKL